jgi:LysM repeat protein
MQTHNRHALWLTLALILTLGLAGCYRSAGEDTDPTQVNENVTPGVDETPTDDVQLPPSFTPRPDGDQQTPTVTGTAALAPTVEQATDLPTALPTATFAELPPIGDEASATPEPTATSMPEQLPAMGPTATNTQVALPTTAPTLTFTASWTPRPPTSTATYTPSWTPLPPTHTYTPSPAPITYTPMITYTPSRMPPPSFTPIPSRTPTRGPTATFTVAFYPTFTPSPTLTPYVVAAAPQATAPVEAQPLAERDATTPPPPADDASGQGGGPNEVAMQQTLSPYQATATALVFNATATAAATQGVPLPGATQPPPAQPGGQLPTATTAPAIPAAGSTPVTQNQVCGEHLIAPGETLYRIALRYGVTTNQIVQMNGIVNPDLIKAGDTLTIPCPIPATPTPIATAAGTGPGQGGVGTPATGPFTYIVEPGDNLYRISLRYGVSMANLMATNGLTPATINTIYAGQELYIPASTQTTTGQPIPTQTPNFAG